MRHSILFVVSLSLAAVAAAEPGEERYSVSPVQNASVRVAVLPTYPKKALRKSLDGEVTVAFTISRFGRARDPEIVTAQPSGLFDNAVIDALLFWIFDPARPVNCGTVEQRATQTFRFRHADSNPVQVLPVMIEGLPTMPREQHKASLEEIRVMEEARRNQSQTVSPRGLVPVKRVEPEYPEGALERRIEGVVSVSFLIERDGSVTEPVVVDAVKGSVFRSAALRALRQWQFEPSVQEGETVERTGCHEFLFLADDYKIKQQQKGRREKSNMRTFKPN